MKNINTVSFKKKKVLIRVDFNLPLNENLEITDDSRMVAALPTIKKVVSDGGVAIILSHLGRPKNSFDETLSLKHVVKNLSELLDLPVSFSSDCIGEKTAADVKKMRFGGIIVLENLRFYKEEISGNIDFARKLASLGDVYINDAFGAAHRKHASTSVIARFFPKNKYFGFLLANELLSLEKVLKNPKRPFTAIIGGAKISGKIDVIISLFEKVDVLIIGGGMAYTFIKALGGDIGNSLVENDKILLAKEIITEAEKKKVELFLPVDSVNAKSVSNKEITSKSDVFSINPKEMGLDIGKKSIDKFVEEIAKSKTLIWNGPMGVFELEKFESGTKQIGEAICLATKKGAFSLIGGGDSVAALKKFNLIEGVSYVSTGGGAMLEYLEGKTLPGIVAIQH